MLVVDTFSSVRPTGAWRLIIGYSQIQVAMLAALRTLSHPCEVARGDRL